jgi:hypothetical protein
MIMLIYTRAVEHPVAHMGRGVYQSILLLRSLLLSMRIQNTKVRHRSRISRFRTLE